MTEPAKKRNKPNYYIQKKRKQFILEPGLRGFLCTCNFREKECIREAYNLLNTYVDKSEENQTKEQTQEEPEQDISEELTRELNACKSESKQKRFQVVESGAQNVLFIRTTVKEPVQLAVKIIEDILTSQQQKTRFLLRLIPIEITCKANVSALKSAAIELIDQHFNDTPKTYAIVYNHRFSNQFKKDEVVNALGELIAGKNSKHKVDLNNAELTLIVEVIKGMCLMSIVPDYKKYRKYNLIQLVDSGQIKEEKDEKIEESVAANE